MLLSFWIPCSNQPPSLKINPERLLNSVISFEMIKSDSSYFIYITFPWLFPIIKAYIVHIVHIDFHFS